MAKPKSTKQAVAKAQPKKTKPTGVTKENGHKVPSKPEQPNRRTLPSKSDKIGKAKLDPVNQPIDTGATDTNSNQVQNKGLPKGAKTKRLYKTSQRTPYK
jgi:hypothetical protein